MIFRKGLPYLIMSGLIVLQMLAYEYNKVIKKGPESTHQWRQCDCLAITQMYYQYNVPFLEPELLHIGASGNGKCSTSEMPIVYFTMAKLWKSFGKHEWFFRGFEALLLFLALLALFHLYSSFLPKYPYSAALVSLFFSSPILAYYGANFIMDSPALCLSIIGCCFWFEYYWRKQTLFFGLAVLLFTCAGLLKISAAAAYFAFSLLLLTDLLGISKFNLWPENKKRQMALFGLFPMVIWLPWNIYAYHYNQANGNGNIFFLTGIMPIWDLDVKEIKNISNLFLANIKMQVFHRSMFQVLILGQFLTFIFYKKHVHKFVFWFSNTLILVLITYVLLFFQVFNVHDYYLVNMLIVAAFVLLNIGIVIQNLIKERVIFKPSVLVLTLMLLAYNVYYCAGKTYIKYNLPAQKPFFKYSYTPAESSYWSWFHWDYGIRFKPLEGLKSKLTDIGIPQDEPIIVMGDQSINISLYFLEKRGFTRFMIGSRRNNIDVKTYKHIIFLTKAAMDNDVIQPYIGNVIYQDGELSIYTTRPLSK